MILLWGEEKSIPKTKNLRNEVPSPGERGGFFEGGKGGGKTRTAPRLEGEGIDTAAGL